jgi:hypothetical protein
MIQPLLFLAAATQGLAVTASSPPPPVVVSSDSMRTGGVISAAPTIAVGRIPVVAQPNEVARVHLRVAAGNRTLFDDDMRVGRSSGASYSESRSEAPEINCSADRYYGGGGERDSLNVQLYYRDEPQVGPAISVNVTWQRPTATTTCPNEGSRSVSLVQTVRLAPGETETIRGDAGLVVTLTRR